MTEQEYFEQRVDDQIKWFGKKSSWHKKRFLTLKITETVLALLIPFLVGYITTETKELKAVVGMIGVLVAAITSFITLYKLQENWVQYRAVSESLLQEKFLYITKSGIYKEDASFSLFVERFESLLSKENMQWTSYITQKKEEGKNG